MISIPGYGAPMPTSKFASRHWPLWLLAIGIAWALVAFFVLSNLPGFTKVRGPVLEGLWTFALVVLALAGAIIWLFALIRPDPTSLTVLKVHAALLTVFIALTAAASAPADGPSALFVPMIYGFFVTVLGIELLIMAFAEFRVRMRYGHPSVLPFLYLGLVAMTAGGLYAGAAAWASQPPTRFLNAAGAAAQSRPYCLDVAGLAARSRDDVASIRWRAIEGPSRYAPFRLLLVIGMGADRQYMNWSFRTGQFEPVSAWSRPRLRLDFETRCAPVPDFGGTLR